MGNAALPEGTTGISPGPPEKPEGGTAPPEGNAGEREGNLSEVVPAPKFRLISVALSF